MLSQSETSSTNTLPSTMSSAATTYADIAGTSSSPLTTVAQEQPSSTPGLTTTPYQPLATSDKSSTSTITTDAAVSSTPLVHMTTYQAVTISPQTDVVPTDQYLMNETTSVQGVTSTHAPAIDNVTPMTTSPLVVHLASSTQQAFTPSPSPDVAPTSQSLMMETTSVQEVTPSPTTTNVNLTSPGLATAGYVSSSGTEEMSTQGLSTLNVELVASSGAPSSTPVGETSITATATSVAGYS